MKNFTWEVQEHDFFLNQKDNWKITSMIDALKYLGDPHKTIEHKVIHIAGTNGKGSTANYIKTILETAGYKVGLYTSPHLVEYNERIYFNGRLITDEEIYECKKEIILKCKNLKQISFFEATTLIAIMMFSNYFKKSHFNKLDYCIFEVGLGGRLDATNIFQKPVASVITSISFDHTQILGDTLDKIAYEKAGIIKNNTPVFTSNTDVTIVNVIKDVANSKATKVFCLNEDFTIDYSLKPSLNGKHQFQNATLAKEVCKYIGVNKNDIEYGISHTIWRGRLQQITLKHIDNVKLNIKDIYLDGAHNEDGVKQLCNFIKTIKTENTNIIGVMASLKRKNYYSFFNHINNNIFDTLLCFNVKNNSDDFVSPQQLVKLAQKYNIITKEIDDFSNLSLFTNNTKTNIVIIFGSLYFVGFVLERFAK